VLIGGLEAGDDVDAGVQDRAWLSLLAQIYGVRGG
jgi:hypothetical protein